MCLELLSACCVPRCLTFIKSFRLSLEARRLFPFWGGLGWEFLPWHMALAPSFPSLYLRLCLSFCPRTSRRRAAPTLGLAHPCCSVSAGCPRDISETWDVWDTTWLFCQPPLSSQPGLYRLYDLGPALDFPWSQFLLFKMGITIPKGFPVAQ